MRAMSSCYRFTLMPVARSMAPAGSGTEDRPLTRPRKPAGLIPSTWPWRIRRRRPILPIRSGGALAGRLLLRRLALGLVGGQETLGLGLRGAATLEAAAQRVHQ